MSLTYTPPPLSCSQPELRAGAQGIRRVAVDDAAQTLRVTFYKPITPPEGAEGAYMYALDPRSYSLTGGRRLFPHVLAATLHPDDAALSHENYVVRLTLDGEGDLSTYTLTVNGPDVDPLFASHTFRFRLACDDPFDCCEAPPEPSQPPELDVAIDYLAKDYASFRQALLDFIPTRLPEWTERSEADIGMMLLELFAATADQLSYLQDRVANEAFLSSAIQRQSVARHLALLGYQMDEGASAHTWLQFQVSNDVRLLGDHGLRVSAPPDSRGKGQPCITFETQGAVSLRRQHNGPLPLYTWDQKQCSLSHAALSAALDAECADLAVGDYLLFDDGHGHRDIVRLTARAELVPADPIKAKPNGPITVVRWSRVTPLHYDYCASETFAYGNLVLATHGETIEGDLLRSYTSEQRAALQAEIAARPTTQRAPRQRLRLNTAPLAHLDASTVALIQGTRPTPAPTDVLARVPRSVSGLTLTIGSGSGPEHTWHEVPSLLGYGPEDRVFRVEINDMGEATVVFGDGICGSQPDETANITATYRVGGGTVGNVAADTLTALHAYPGREDERLSQIVAVTNPLPATGGRDLESREHARHFAPATFQIPLVAVTVEDYAAAAQSFVDADGSQPIQRAAADFRWTGSWLTATLTVDPRETERLDPSLARSLLTFLEARRLAGYDIAVASPVYVPLDLVIEFCAAIGYRPLDVKQKLINALSAGDLQDGTRGFFHPDNFTFGDSVYLSHLYAAIMAVPGVASAHVKRLARLRSATPDADTARHRELGYLPIGPHEIACLDNNRNFPQSGTLAVLPKGVG